MNSPHANGAPPLGGGAPAADGNELVRETLQLHGEALEKLLTQVHDALGAGSSEFFTRICEDPVVESVLCLHGLHPLSVEERVKSALRAARPYVQAHAGAVDLLYVLEDVACVRMSGTYDGLKNAVESAILARVPEIREVRIEADPSSPKIIDLTALPFGA